MLKYIVTNNVKETQKLGKINRIRFNDGPPSLNVGKKDSNANIKQTDSTTLKNSIPRPRKMNSSLSGIGFEDFMNLTNNPDSETPQISKYLSETKPSSSNSISENAISMFYNRIIGYLSISLDNLYNEIIFFINSQLINDKAIIDMTNIMIEDIKEQLNTLIIFQFGKNCPENLLDEVLLLNRDILKNNRNRIIYNIPDTTDLKSSIRALRESLSRSILDDTNELISLAKLNEHEKPVQNSVFELKTKKLNDLLDLEYRALEKKYYIDYSLSHISSKLENLQAMSDLAEDKDENLTTKMLTNLEEIFHSINYSSFDGTNLKLCEYSQFLLDNIRAFTIQQSEIFETTSLIPEISSYSCPEIAKIPLSDNRDDEYQKAKTFLQNKKREEFIRIKNLLKK